MAVAMIIVGVGVGVVAPVASGCDAATAAANYTTIAVGVVVIGIVAMSSGNDSTTPIVPPSVATVGVDVVGRVTINGWVIIAIIASVMDVVNQRRRFSKDASVIMSWGGVIKLNRRKRTHFGFLFLFFLLLEEPLPDPWDLVGDAVGVGLVAFRLAGLPWAGCTR